MLFFVCMPYLIIGNLVEFILALKIIVWPTILLLMAVVEPTQKLSRSLLAQFIRIPALVHTTSFLRKAKTIHLTLGASRLFSYPQIQFLVVWLLIILFTQKQVSLSLVAVLQCTSPQASGKGIEFCSTVNFILQIQILLFFHYSLW